MAMLLFEGVVPLLICLDHFKGFAAANDNRPKAAKSCDDDAIIFKRHVNYKQKGKGTKEMCIRCKGGAACDEGNSVRKPRASYIPPISHQHRPSLQQCHNKPPSRVVRIASPGIAKRPQQCAATHVWEAFDEPNGPNSPEQIATGHDWLNGEL